MPDVRKGITNPPEDKGGPGTPQRWGARSQPRAALKLWAGFLDQKTNKPPLPDFRASFQDPQLLGVVRQTQYPPPTRLPAPRRLSGTSSHPLPPAYLQGGPRGAAARSSSGPLAQSRRPGGLPFLQPAAGKLPPLPPPPRRPPRAPGVGGSRVRVQSFSPAEFGFPPLAAELAGTRAPGEGRWTLCRPPGAWRRARPSGNAGCHPEGTGRAGDREAAGDFRAPVGSRGSQSPPPGLALPDRLQGRERRVFLFRGQSFPRDSYFIGPVMTLNALGIRDKVKLEATLGFLSLAFISIVNSGKQSCRYSEPELWSLQMMTFLEPESLLPSPS